MKVAIVGTGNMARGIGARALAGGHEVALLGKQASDAEQLAAELGGEVTTGVSTDPIDADLVVLAVYYPDARSFVEASAERLDGRAVVDVSNPVNESFDALVTPPDGSAAAELARLAPGARLVKAFNTTFARTLVRGEVAGQPLDVLIAGDDEAAKAAVATLVEDGGLRSVDAGPLSRARELEALGLLHITLQRPLGTGFASAIKLLGPPPG
jgi:8-hydroxy-5-deazaflavin:NADPH oxidoreductase